MSEPISNVVERVPKLDAQHPPSQAVTKRVSGDVLRRATTLVGVRSDVSLLGAPFDDVVDRLRRHSRTRLREEQHRRLFAYA